MPTEPKEAESLGVKFGFLFHRVTNPAVRLILRSPMHSLLSGKLILIAYVGRRSGVKHTLPVMYTNWNGELVVVVGYHWNKKWWRNLRGQPVAVEVRYRGQLVEGSAMAIEGDVAMISPRLMEYFKKFPASARRRGLSPGPDIDERALADRAKDVVMVIIRRDSPKSGFQVT
jgi:hypothetical protein